MIQQVNLFEDIGQSSASSNEKKYLLLLPLFCLLLLGFSLFSLWSLKRQEDQLQHLQQQQKEVAVRVELLQMQYSSRQIDSLLADKLQQTKKAEQLFSKLLNDLNTHVSDQTRGFSRYFSALANQADGSSWLSRIHINAEKHTLTMQGSSFSADKIPVFLDRLQHESAFKGWHFAHLRLQQSPVETQQIDFTVTSSLEELDELEP